VAAQALVVLLVPLLAAALLLLLLLLLLPQPAATSAVNANAAVIIRPFTAIDLLLRGSSPRVLRLRR
jgi:hypothetical protein